MKQKVKVIVAFLLVAILALSAFGCSMGPDNDGVIAEGEVVEVKGKVKLNYYMAQTDGEKRSVNEWVAAFQKNYPDVDVEIEATYLTDKSRIDSQISSGTVGDVFFLTDVELYNYAVVQDVLMPLNYYIEEYKIDLIVLAGFMSILSESFTSAYPKRILNVHPSLIPSFCGAGFYGLRVHEAALAYGVKVTGATVHFVNEIPDGGEIVMQKAVEIEDGDTPEVLQRRVMERAEWKILPAAVEKVSAEIISK